MTPKDVFSGDGRRLHLQGAAMRRNLAILLQQFARALPAVAGLSPQGHACDRITGRLRQPLPQMPKTASVPFDYPDLLVQSVGSD